MLEESVDARNVTEFHCQCEQRIVIQRLVPPCFNRVHLPDLHLPNLHLPDW